MNSRDVPALLEETARLLRAAGPLPRRLRLSCHWHDTGVHIHVNGREPYTAGFLQRFASAGAVPVMPLPALSGHSSATVATPHGLITAVIGGASPATDHIPVGVFDPAGA